MELDQLVIDDADRCWPWAGYIAPAGHGFLRADGRTQTVHRFVYELVRGPLAKGVVLHHTCGRAACANPAHLAPMSQSRHRGLEATRWRGRLRAGDHLRGLRSH